MDFADTITGIGTPHMTGVVIVSILNLLPIGAQTCHFTKSIDRHLGLHLRKSPPLVVATRLDGGDDITCRIILGNGVTRDF